MSELEQIPRCCGQARCFARNIREAAVVPAVRVEAIEGATEMRTVREFETELPYEVLWPAETNVPFLFNSPHSGRQYPERFLAASRLDRTRIRRSEDS